MSFTSLTVSLTHASGPIGRVAAHNLSIFLSALRLEGVHASGSAALRGRPTTEFTSTPRQLEELCLAAEAAGFEDRLPAVEAVEDTSDHWAWVLLHVSDDRCSRTLELNLLSSGFRGPDAPALRLFFDVLLSMAGVTDDSIRHDLTER
ncbi:MAG: hypothetical protein JO332_13360 [Planctomycetaceae bacterium]|nr:hypothetical protein [Planctomycetaceae bacterium]